MPKSSERFARQYRYELPPGFPLASPCSGIGHHLSGLNSYAPAQLCSRLLWIDSMCFHFALEFKILTLAQMFNSLVRVSRRVVCQIIKAIGSITWCNVQRASHDVLRLSLNIQDMAHASTTAISGILTLLSECFSTFPHGTCLLSVSLQYLALDDSYHPIYILRPKNVTPLTVNQTTLEKTLTAFHRQWKDFPDFSALFWIQLIVRYNSDY